jgi:uncharacterized protein with HEPN domain
MKTFFIHEYFGFDLNIPWKIIEFDMPEKKVQISEIHEIMK